MGSRCPRTGRQRPPQHGRRVSHSRPPREWINNHVRTANHTPWNQQVCPGRGSSIQQGALGRVNLFPPRPYLTGAKPQQAPDPAMHTHTQTHGPDCHGQRSDHPHNVWVLTSKIRLWIQAAKRNFLCREARLYLRLKLRSLDIWRKIVVEPLAVLGSNGIHVPPLRI